MTYSSDVPDARGHFGTYGGRFVPEALVAALDELTAAYEKCRHDQAFQAELAGLHATYTGRPSPVTDARRFAEHAGGARVLLKREDLNHTGSHKINNVLGQALLTRDMGKTRVIAETGAGQHGVATATAAALLGLECVVYMGAEDTRRQALNVARMRLLGAEVIAVDGGQPDPQGRHQRGDARLGHQRRPHPLHPRHGHRAAPVPGHGPRLPADHRRRGAPAGARPDRRAAGRGRRLRRRRLERDGHLHRVPRRPRRAALRLRGRRRGHRQRPARGPDGRWLAGRPARHPHLRAAGRDGPDRCRRTRSRPGLDYPGVGPQHAWLHDTGRATYAPITDTEAMDAFALLCRTEGIIPAIESAHALAGAMQVGRELGPDATVLVNLSGRGDKDVDTAATWFDVVSDEELVAVGDGRGRAGPAGRVGGGLVTTPVSRLDDIARGRPGRGPGRAGGLPAGRLPLGAGRHRRDRRDGPRRRRRRRDRPALLGPADGRPHHPARRRGGARSAAPPPTTSSPRCAASRRPARRPWS